MSARPGCVALLFVLLVASSSIRICRSAQAEDDAPEVAVRALFDKLEAAVAKGDRRAVSRLFDAHAMFEALEGAGYLAGLPPKKRAELGARLGMTLSLSMSRTDIVGAFGQYDLLRLSPDASGDRAVARVRQRGAGGATTRRWFLVKRRRGWRIYDFEDVATGMRLTLIMGSAMLATVEGRPGFKQASVDLQVAGALLESGDARTALDVAGAIPTGALPAPLEGFRQSLVGAALIELGDAEAALPALDAAHAATPDAPLVDLLRAQALNQRGDHQAALVAATAYTKRVGSDPFIALEIGLAEAGLGHLDRAIASFESGLSEDPGDVELLTMLALALPGARKSRVFATLKRSGNQPQVLDALLDRVLAEEDAETARALLRELPAGEALVSYYRGRLADLEGRHEKAIEFYAAALRASYDTDAHDRFAWAWAWAVVRSGRAMEGYAQTSGDLRPAMLKRLGFALIELADFDALAALTKRAAHETRRPSPALPYFESLVLLQQGRSAPAARKLNTLYERLDPTDALRLDVEDALVRAFVRSGQARSALHLAQQIADRDDNPLYLAIAFAHLGKPQEALRAMTDTIDTLGPGAIFDDEDLAAILETAPYRSLGGR